MSQEQFHRIVVGEFACIILNDGTHNYKPSGFFANVPEDLITAELAANGLPTDIIRSPFTSIYVDTGTHRVVIDTGAGRVISTAGRLQKALAAAGVQPRDVDIVLLTHGHPDHIGGVLDESGAPIYSVAEHIFPSVEHGYWTSQDARDGEPPQFVKMVEDLFEAVSGTLRLIQSDQMIVPGITAIPAPGHTRGHIAVSIKSGEDELLYVSDTAFHPLHLRHPDWIPGGHYLDDAQQYKDSVRRVFDKAAQSACMVLAMHFDPFPSLGYVESDGSGWRWRAVT